MQLVLATHNQHKVAEVGAILASAVEGLELIGYEGPEPIEDGTSFLENAMIKARAAFEFTGQPSIADDSGLAVEILGGSPGIFSARWSGTRDNVTNRQLVLAFSDYAYIRRYIHHRYRCFRHRNKRTRNLNFTV